MLPMTDKRLDGLLAQIPPLDLEAMQEARDRQAQLTKPVGALGVLEDTSVRLSGITRPHGTHHLEETR